jgi:hypothetical protein
MGKWIKKYDAHEIVQMHEMARDIYVAGFTNPADNGYVKVGEAWDYAIGFQDASKIMLEALKEQPFNPPEDEQEEEENG